ncbi:MAG: TonB-dependent receptor, partial [Alistipes sp.]|nr:TonB-dependent receptor [Alistipes sp.]
FYYDAEHAKSETVNFLGYTIKGGVNFNIDRYNNVFFNIGYISRAPFFSGGAFLNSTISNAINNDAVNEKIFSAEVGYGFKSSKFALNLNAYYTLWMDKTMTATGSDYQYELDGVTVTDRPKINLQGVDARHMGIELDFVAQPTKWLDINGMLSLGDWQWNSNATGLWYNEAGQPMADSKGSIATASGVTEWTPEIGQIYGVSEADFKPHAKTTVNLKGVKVGNSAQTTALIGATFKPMKGMRIGIDWSVYARNYAAYAISNPSMNGTASYETPWQIPWGNQFDLNISYGFKVGSCKATVYGNINNLFNQEYITDAYDGATHDWDSAYRVFYAFGRTFSLRLKLNF